MTCVGEPVASIGFLSNMKSSGFSLVLSKQALRGGVFLSRLIRFQGGHGIKEF